jgi:glycosyltransferase involved in cell wall biosynthesis
MTAKAKKSKAKISSPERTIRPVLIASGQNLVKYRVMLQNLLLGLTERSIPVTLVCEAGADIKNFLISNVDIVTCPVIDLPFTRSINSQILVRNLEKYKPDIVHCLCYSKSHLACRIARAFDIPCLVNFNRINEKPYRLIAHLELCSQLIVPTILIAEKLTNTHPHLGEKISTIYIGCFSEEKPTCFVNRSDIVNLATYSPEHNPHDLMPLLRTVRHLAIQGREFVLVIISQTLGADTEIRKMTSGLGISKNVIFCEPTHPISPVMAACDIFIQPTTAYDFNPLLLQAMSAGCAVTACAGGYDELVVPDKTALVFKPEDQQQIYDCLIKLLDSRELSRKIAQNCLDLTHTRHSPADMIENIFLSYQTAIYHHKQAQI